MKNNNNNKRNKYNWDLLLVEYFRVLKIERIKEKQWNMCNMCKYKSAIWFEKWCLRSYDVLIVNNTIHLKCSKSDINSLMLRIFIYFYDKDYIFRLIWDTKFYIYCVIHISDKSRNFQICMIYSCNETIIFISAFPGDHCVLMRRNFVH